MAQNYATIGTGTTSSSYSNMFRTSYSDAVGEAWFSAAELTAAGLVSGDTILSVGWDVAGNAGDTMFNANASIGQFNSMPTTTTALTGLTNVWSGDHVITTGWNDFSFSTGLVWNGVDGILVRYCFDNDTTGSTPSMRYTYTYTSGGNPAYSARYYYDYYGTTSGCMLTANYNSSTKANTRFSHVAGVPFALGCMDSTAYNYDPTAVYDDGSCIFMGCTNPIATNYDANANMDDGSCLIEGCTDMIGDLNGDGDYDDTMFGEDGTGMAFNWDPTANVDDSSCVYCPTGNISITATMGAYASENSWELLDAAGNVVMSHQYTWSDNNSSFTHVGDTCFTPGCYTMIMYDTYGDGWNSGGNLLITDQMGMILAQETFYGYLGTSDTCPNGSSWGCISYEFTFNIGGSPCPVPGCTNPIASNYDASADYDDGSCIVCDSTQTILNLTYNAESGASYQSFLITSSPAGDTIYYAPPYFVSTWGSVGKNLCFDDGCYDITLMSSGWSGGWATGAFLEVTDGVNAVQYTMPSGSGGSVTYQWALNGPCYTWGCTDTAAINFDSTATADDGSCMLSCKAAPYTENFDNGIGSFVQSATDAFDWTLDASGTPSGSTGPSDDITGGGNYLFTESSGNYYNTAILSSECLDISTLNCAELSFAYHMYGADMGELMVLVNGDTLWTMSGDQGNQWNIAQVDLNAYSGVDVTIEFVGTTGSSYTSDMAIDNVSVDECVIYGCNDPLAPNYDTTATADDGSCHFYCNDNTFYMELSAIGSYYGWNGATYSIVDASGNVYASGMGTTNSSDVITDSICLPNGCDYSVIVTSTTYSSYAGYINWSLTNASNGYVAATGGAVYGSNDTTGFVGDMSCNIYGCTDSTAANYDSWANTDDASCVYCSDAYVNVSFWSNWASDEANCDFVLFDGNGDTVLAGEGVDADVQLCLGDGCYSLQVNSSTSYSANYMYFMMTDVATGDTLAYVDVANGPQDPMTLAYTSVADLAGFGCGCTNPLATNYDATATVDDGNCVVCDDTYVDIDMYGTYSSYESYCTFSIFNANGDTVYSGAATDATMPGCFVDDCYTLEVYSTNSYGAGYMNLLVTGANGDTLSMVDVSNGTQDPNTLLYTSSFDMSGFGCGCTDTAAANYDASATVDNGACVICSDNFFYVDVNSYSSYYDGMVSWVITNSNGDTTANGGAGHAGTLCVPTDCYSISWSSSSSSYALQYYTMNISDASGNIVASSSPTGQLMSWDESFEGWFGCIFGCTDVAAVNYDSTANANDGSCEYPCYDNAVTITCGGGSYTSEVSWTLTDASGAIVAAAGAPYNSNFCLADGCYYLDMVDSWGDGWNGNTFMVVDTAGAFVAAETLASGTNGSAQFYVGVGVCPVYGCMDSLAMNYDPAANTSDSSCMYACTAAPYAENFDLSLGTWTQSTTDGFDWSWDASGTPSGSTGPSDDMTGGGYYLFTESSGNYSNTATITSECLDISMLNCAELQFAYNMYGAAMGSLSVSVNGNVEWTMSGDQGMGWNIAQVSLAAYAGVDVTIEITGTTGTSYTSDMAIDNISVGECVIYGCMDSLASNYDASATNDDGSCNFYCNDNTFYMEASAIGSYYGWNGATWSVVDANGTVYASGVGTFDNSSTEYDSICLPAGCDYSVIVTSTTYSSYASYISWSLTSDNGYVAASGGGVYGSNDTTNFVGDMSCAIYGCTDSTASNYDMWANTDDSSCVYCSDTWATVDLYGTYASYEQYCTFMILNGNGDTVLTGAAADGPVNFCMADDCYSVQVNSSNSYSGNYMNLSITDNAGNSLALVDVSSGAQLPGSLDYISTDDIAGFGCGCTNPAAANYDSTATVDNGACILCTDNFGALTVGGGSYMSEVSWTLNGSDGTVVASGGAPYTGDLCLTDDCYTLNMTDSWGDGWNGNTWSFTVNGVTFNETLASGSSGSVILSGSALGCVAGCTDSLATNYDATANADDGSCVYPCYDNELTLVLTDAGFDGWGSGFYSSDLTVTDANGVSTVYALASGYSDSIALCLADGCYNFTTSGNESWSSEVGFNVLDASGNVLASGSDYGSWDAAFGNAVCPVYGCTDSTASNYDAAADTDDGSCTYPCLDNAVTFFMYDSWGDGWNGNTYAISDLSGNTVATGTLASGSADSVDLCIPDGCYDIVVGGGSYGSEVSFDFGSLNGAGTGSYQITIGAGSCPVYGCTDSTACNFDAAADTDDNSCTYPAATNLDCSGACLNDADLDGICDEDEIAGCTDMAADNYDSTATDNDGSCTYCSTFALSIDSQTDATVNGACDGTVSISGSGGTAPYNVSYTFNPSAVCAGTYTVTGTDANGCTASITVIIDEPAPPAACQDVTGFEVNDMVTNDPDGSRIKWEWDGGNQYDADHYQIRHRPTSQTSGWNWDASGPANGVVTGQSSKMKYFLAACTEYEAQIRRKCVGTGTYSGWSTTITYTTPCPCPQVTNMTATNIEDTWVTFNWDSAAVDSSQYVHWYLIRFSEDGGNTWGYKDPGTNLTAAVGNRTPNTNIQWQVRTYCNGDNYYRSDWANATFTSEVKPTMPTNLNAVAPSTLGAPAWQNDANYANFSWDLPTGPTPHHYMIALYSNAQFVGYRGSHNPSAGSYLSGSTTDKTFGNLTAGTTYAWRMRAYHTTGIIYYGNALGLTWRSEWTPSSTFTTAASAREGYAPVADLEVYPNPSNDIFNVTFASEETQTINVKVVNMIGEEVYTENLEEFVGQYTKSIDLNTQPKGVYFLEITTDKGGINKKIVLQ
jgi:hypothetical protein